MTAIQSSNFGLNTQPAQQLDLQYDDWFWQSEEAKEAGAAFRGQKRNIKLQDKQAEANQKNAMAAAMTAIAQDLQNPVAADNQGGNNTMLWIIGGVAVVGLVVGGIWYMTSRKKQNALETPAAATAN